MIQVTSPKPPYAAFTNADGHFIDEPMYSAASTPKAIASANLPFIIAARVTPEYLDVAKFRRAGLVRTSRGRIVVVDVVGLSQFVSEC